jgi:putative hydrolase of the HAD superfamily
MQPIKNIIFDLGGVLLDIDYNKTAQAFIQLGASNFNQFYSQTTANQLFENVETGLISDDDFYAAMQAHCNPGTTFAQIQTAWNAILLDFRKESMAYLQQLKPQYNLYLLSNTNHIHHQAFQLKIQQQLGYNSVDDFFITAFYSHQIKKRKPYKSTYQYVIDRLQIAPTQTLFIDDSIINIGPAAAIGIQTHLLLPTQKIEQLGLL